MDKEKPATVLVRVTINGRTHFRARRDGFFHEGWGKTKDGAIKDLLEWEGQK